MHRKLDLNALKTRELFRECRFVEAAASAQRDLEQDSWLDAALILVRERPIFFKRQTAIESEPFFLAVFEGLSRKQGEGEPQLAAATENLASLWTSIGKYTEAAELREQQYRRAKETLKADDPALLIARDNLAILYRNAGQDAKAVALYADTGICEHLQPVLTALLEEGATIVSCGQPWSRNCHIWVYLDRVIACEPFLGSGLEIHDHQGTHDGSERGLVCNMHHDAVMGMHPGQR